MNNPAMRTSIFIAQGILLAGLLMPTAVLAADATTPSPTTVTPAANNTGATGQDGNFVPLTQLPGIKDISNANNFSDFLNTLYKVCIGASAVLAVIMIMYAGVLFMTSAGSVSSNEKAKSYLSNALLGLVLVLTPTIVFGIINPSILNINIGQEFAKLQGANLQDLSNSTGGDSSAPAACTKKYASISAISKGQTCPVGTTNADLSCCPKGTASDAVCCGKEASGGGGGGGGGGGF